MLAPPAVLEPFPYGAFAVENLLVGLGYNPGTVDGIADARTTKAIRLYQARYGLPMSGQMSGELLMHVSDTVRRWMGR